MGQGSALRMCDLSWAQRKIGSSLSARGRVTFGVEGTAWVRPWGGKAHPVALEGLEESRGDERGDERLEGCELARRAGAGSSEARERRRLTHGLLSPRLSVSCPPPALCPPAPPHQRPTSFLHFLPAPLCSGSSCKGLEYLFYTERASQQFTSIHSSHRSRPWHRGEVTRPGSPASEWPRQNSKPGCVCSALSSLPLSSPGKLVTSRVFFLPNSDV